MSIHSCVRMYKDRPTLFLPELLPEGVCEYS